MSDALGRGLAIGGFMATGKTTVGERLASRLGLPFVDLDQLVEAREGASVADLFRTRGEAGFRAAEVGALQDALARGPTVLSLGGGTLHQPGLAASIRAVMPIVVLRASWAVVADRLARDQGQRPLAGHPGVRSLYDYRQPGYAAAGPVVDVDDLDADAVVARILEVCRC